MNDSPKTQVSRLLDQGFDQIQADFALMMSCLSEILVEFGKSRFQVILPIVGDPDRISELNEADQREAVGLLSLAFQVLNVVEQNATNDFRNAVVAQVGPEYVSGSVAEVIAELRARGHEWAEISAIWQRISLQLVFTAHPTESRRPSLIAQLRQFFTDLQTSNGSRRRRDLILKNLECLMGTGEFIQDKPSVDTERDFITRTIRGSLPDSLALFVNEVHSAFVSLGCPPESIPLVSNYPRVRFRSWVASDRDGHPYVTAEETRLTLDRNRHEALQIVRDALNELGEWVSLSRNRVVVPPVISDRFPQEEPWRAFCQMLEGQVETTDVATLLTELNLITATLHEAGAHLLAHEAALVVLKVKTFGFHLVSQDSRQNSASYHAAVMWILDQTGMSGARYDAMSDSERCDFITQELRSPRRFLPPDFPLSGPANDAIESLRVVADAIRTYGSECMGSIIVSMTRQSSDLLQVLLIAREAGLLSYTLGATPICLLPIVPLIETAEDHHHVISILTGFIHNPMIAATIQYHHQREQLPGVPGVRMMCGHSDGGKDAGIIDNFRLMRDTREKVAEFLANNGYAPIFFEGVGGTLIRGAAPIKYLIANSLPSARVAGFEYTEQGQIIAQNHLVPFMSAWSIQNALSALLHHEAEPNATALPAWFTSATQVASTAYRALVSAPEFAGFFTHVTPLDILEFARMGSRPTRRTGANTLADLRAIPFALCQSQTRFNFTAWYGVGTMLQTLRTQSPSDFKQLRTFSQIEFVLTNVEMALKSASLEWMTAYSMLEPDADLRALVMDTLCAEYELTTRMLDEVFGASFEVRRPRLARTIAKRKEMLDVLHRFQIHALTEWRSARRLHREDEDAWLVTGLMTINAISNGLRGTG